jgi:WD40 repeat protein
MPLLIFLIALLFTSSISAQSSDACPVSGVQTSVERPSGVIITAFDKRNLWAVNLDKRTRFPLEGTRPCGTNCHLSPDFLWMTFLNPVDGVFSKMRLNGAWRTPLTNNATEVSWWSDNTLLVWSPEHGAALVEEGSGERETLLNAKGAISIQPGGRWALKLRYDGEYFRRVLVNLEDETRSIDLGGEVGTAVWTPDGKWLVYPTHNDDGEVEVFGVNPAQGEPEQWTDLPDGQAPLGDISPSPDGNKLAFWTTPPENAYLHIYDRTTGETRRYCAISEAPTRLVWSPDSTHLAFKANPEEDTRGYLLIALNVEAGVYIELSDGIYPSADLVVWGYLPQ